MLKKITKNVRRRRMAPRPRSAPDTKLLRPNVVVFGIDRNGSSRGARFSGKQLLLAGEAAITRGLDVFEAINREMQGLAEVLPPGRVFANGFAFFPIIPKALHRRLHVASGGLVRDRTSRKMRGNS
jgi:hypothetical protein